MDLERNEALAILSAMSGDRALTRAAPLMQRQVESAREYKAEAERLRQKRQTLQNMGNGFFYDPETGRTFQPEDYRNFIEAERNADVAAQKALINARLGASLAEILARQKAGEGNDPALTPTHEQKAREADRIVLEASNVLSGMYKTPGTMHRGKDVAIALAEKAAGTVGARLAEGSLYDEPQNKLRARGASLEQDLSNLAAGLALTGFELEQRQRWSPFAPGITEQQSKDRMDNIIGKFSGKGAAIRGEPAKRRRVVAGKSYVEVEAGVWEEE